MKKLILILAVLAGGAFYYQDQQPPPPAAQLSGPAAQQADVLSETDAAHAAQRSNVQVQGAGEVARVLPDDSNGSRHQRFILRLASGLTVLVAHNIDLAPRIDALQAGDIVEYFGEYEWNEKGGVVHWTHHDPRGSHVGGWLRHDGRTYQ